MKKAQCLEVEVDGTHIYDSALKVQNHFKVPTKIQQGLQMIITKPYEAAFLNLRSVNRFLGAREPEWKKITSFLALTSH